MMTLLRTLAAAASSILLLCLPLPALSDAPRDGGWQLPPKAPAGAPNIVLILLDDVGFSDPATLGGVAQTPAFDALARRGLLYNNFNTTGMCSPTRAALLTGRNHHRVGFGRVADWASGQPGYNGMWKPDTASIAAVLRAQGYSTAAVGKWHNTPEWEVSPVGPFERWPTGLGFEYFYGIMNHGGDNQWEPTSLYRGTTPVEAPARPEQGYHLTQDFVDDALRWVATHQQLAPEKPYFLYLATGATHAPHQVPEAWTRAYRGKFDQGWDRLREEIFARQKALGVVPANAALTPRPPEIPAWDSLDAEQKAVFARQMEVFAGYLAQTDHEIGRLLDAIAAGPDADNTLVIYIAGDNGASGMEGINGHMDGSASVAHQHQHLDELGGPGHLNDYSSAWAWVGSTPFQWMKQVASHFGGLRVGMALAWPRRIKPDGQVRPQFTHVNDIAPTIYELAGIRPPARVDGVRQLPFDGASLAPTFASASAPTPHRTQYFEMLGNRAIYRDGWVASARHMTPWLHPYAEDFSADRWELYDLRTDFSQARDLAAAEPIRLHEMQQLFDREARRNGVFPLANYEEGRDYGAPRLAGTRRHFSYTPALPRVPTKALPRLAGQSFEITAQLQLPARGAEGMLMAYGSRLGGFALYLQQRRLVLANNVYGQVQRLVSDSEVPVGEVQLKFSFRRDEEKAGARSGTARLFINGQPAGEQRLARLGSPVLGAFSVGRAYTSPISTDYALPFAFTGTLKQLEIDLQ